MGEEEGSERERESKKDGKRGRSRRKERVRGVWGKDIIGWEGYRRKEEYIVG